MRQTMLDESEISRIYNKYIYISRFRHSISYLMSCPHFVDARAALTSAGYFDWHIFDAAIQAIGRFRLDPREMYAMTVRNQQELEVRSARSLNYIFTFFELGDEPVPPCERWSADELEFAIHTIGMAWLARRRLLSGEPHFAQDEAKQLLQENGFFSSDPKPDHFPVQN